MKWNITFNEDIKPAESIKVVFLDIDGVLLGNSNAHDNFDMYRKKHDFLVQKLGSDLDKVKPCDVGAALRFSTRAVQNLRALLQQNNAKIVISSNWRDFDNKLKSQQRLKLIFRLWDLDEFIIDETPRLRGSRGLEIRKWLDTTDFKIESFVILDDVDSGLSEMFPTEFVHTADTYFFSDSHLEKAQGILSRNKDLTLVTSMQPVEEKPLSTLFGNVHESYLMDMDHFNIPQYGERVTETLSRLIGGCKIALDWIKNITYSVWLQIEEMAKNQHDKYVLLPLLAWVARNNDADTIDYPVFQYIIKKFQAATEEAMCIATYFGGAEFILRALPYITVASLKRVLETASVMDNVEILNALAAHLKSNPSLMSQFNLNESLLLNDIGEQALHHAVRHECVKAVQFLLEHGVNPNASNKEIFTVTDYYLHLAVRGGNADIVKLLIKHGADLHAVDALNKSPLDTAHEFKHAHLLELLGEKPSKPRSSYHMSKTTGWTEATRNVFHPGDIIQLLRMDYSGYSPSVLVGFTELVGHYLGEGRDFWVSNITKMGQILAYSAEIVPRAKLIQADIRREFPELARFADTLGERNLQELFKSDEKIDALQEEIEKKFGLTVEVHPKKYNPEEIQVVEKKQNQVIDKLIITKINEMSIKEPTQASYPEFLKGLNLRKRKLTALSVANALWLSKMSTVEIEEQKRVFSNWATQEGLKFGLEQVNDCLSQYNMTQRPKAVDIEIQESTSKRVAYPRFLQEMHVKRKKVTPLSSAVAMWLTSKGQKVEVMALKETFFEWAKQEHLAMEERQVDEQLERYTLDQDASFASQLCK